MDPQCRFCHESSSTPQDPLIDPCICTGTLRYVHTDCLRRWARIDPARNGILCSICRTPFTTQVLPPLELLPPEKGFVAWILRNAGMVSFALKYLVFMWMLYDRTIHMQDLIFINSRDMTLSIHTIFAACFWARWSVRNRTLYIRHLEMSRTAFVPIIYGICLISVFLRHDPMLTVVLDILIQTVWADHLALLGRVNRTLLEI